MTSVRTRAQTSRAAHPAPSRRAPVGDAPRLRTFRRIAVPADGDCLFHAVNAAMRHTSGWRRQAANATTRSPPTVADMRRDVAARLRRQRLPRVATRAATPGAWAETEEVIAIASLYHVRLRVWEGANQMWITFGEDAHPLLYLRNIGNVHFEALVPAGT